MIKLLGKQTECCELEVDVQPYATQNTNAQCESRPLTKVYCGIEFMYKKMSMELLNFYYWVSM